MANGTTGRAASPAGGCRARSRFLWSEVEGAGDCARQLTLEDRGRMTAQRGQIFRKPTGLWAIRWRDAEGHRRQRTGFRTKGEARLALEEELRRVRLGPLHRPNITLRELHDAYVKRYDAAPSTVVWLKENNRSHRALRQVLQAGVRWRWTEDNVAAHVKNPEPRPGQIDRSSRGKRSTRSPTSSTGRRAPWSSSSRARACDPRRPSAPSGATSTWSGGC